MSKNNEITAVQASGISLQRLALPALFLGLFFSFLYFLFQENIVPAANISAKNTFYKIKNRKNPTLTGKVYWEKKINFISIMGTLAGKGNLTN